MIPKVLGPDPVVICGQRSARICRSHRTTALLMNISQIHSSLSVLWATRAALPLLVTLLLPLSGNLWQTLQSTLPAWVWVNWLTLIDFKKASVILKGMCFALQRTVWRGLKVNQMRWHQGKCCALCPRPKRSAGTGSSMMPRLQSYSRKEIWIRGKWRTNLFRFMWWSLRNHFTIFDLPFFLALIKVRILSDLLPVHGIHLCTLHKLKDIQREVHCNNLSFLPRQCAGASEALVVSRACSNQRRRAGVPPLAI